MTELLEQVLAKLKNLPANEQDAIAAMILAELEDENFGTKLLPVLQTYLPNLQLRQWLNTVQEGWQNLKQN